MKRLGNVVALVVSSALAFVLTSSLPALANGTSTETSPEVAVASGGGGIPVAKCKWEQEPITELESGDPTHLTSYTQINPPLVWGAKKTVQYYAVVTDQEDRGNVAQVYADVFYPAGSPAPYSTSSDPRGPLFKYELPFAKLGYAQAQRDLVTAASNAGLIKFGACLTIGEVLNEIENGTAALWKGQAEIDYGEPAGLYNVHVHAVDSNNNQSNVLHNQFLYVPTVGIEVDFNKIDYGPVTLGVEKTINGDTNWAAAAPQPAGHGETNQATVRNIGNTWAHVQISQTDMGFGKDVIGAWNMRFDARMGNDNINRVVCDPNVMTTLPNCLALSSQDKLDFSIKVAKGFGTHSGTMTIGAAIEPFIDSHPMTATHNNKDTLDTDLPNVKLISADPTVTKLSISKHDATAIDETQKPEGMGAELAFIIGGTGSGNFTLEFTDIENAAGIKVYKIDPGSIPANQWVELNCVTIANTVAFTMSVGDPLVVFADVSAGPPGLSVVPLFATNPVGVPDTVTAVYAVGGVPRAGVKIHFVVTAGPNSAKAGSAVTDPSGEAKFTYTGTGGVGTDTIKATAVDQAGAPLVSAQATKDWTGGGPVPPTVGGTISFTEGAGSSSGGIGVLIVAAIMLVILIPFSLRRGRMHNTGR